MKYRLLTAIICSAFISSCKTNQSSKANAIIGEDRGYQTTDLKGFRTQCDEFSEGAASSCPILDAQGREILLRGVNARIEGLFDVNFSDGRAPLEYVPKFDQSDTESMRRIGFYFLRLPINWSGIEPSMGTYDKAYLDRVGKVLDICQKAGIRVLLDMHQDAYSKEIGEDGAPLWAIIPKPETRNKGGHLDLYPLRVAIQTQKAFVSFWKNETVNGMGLQEHFINAATAVLARYKNHPALIGMDIFNEPWLLHTNTILKKVAAPGHELDLNLLYSFYEKAIPRMQKLAPQKLVFFEPDMSKNYPPSAPELLYKATLPSTLPWIPAQTVYAPHLYVAAFFTPGDAAAGFPNITTEDSHIDLNVQNSIKEAVGFKAPLVFGEFGFTDKAAQYPGVINKLFNLADKYAFHTAQWLWKENSQDAWGFYDFRDGKPVLREQTARATARAYPLAISGRIHQIQFNPDTYELNVSFRYRATGSPHLLFLPVNYAYTKGYDVTCDGISVESASIDVFGQIAVECSNKNGQVMNLRVVAKK